MLYLCTRNQTEGVIPEGIKTVPETFEAIFESIHKQNESVVQGRKIKTSVKYEIHEVIITSAQTGKNENK